MDQLLIFKTESTKALMFIKTVDPDTRGNGINTIYSSSQRDSRTLHEVPSRIQKDLLLFVGWID